MTTVLGSVLGRVAGQRVQVRLDSGAVVTARSIGIPALGARVVLLVNADGSYTQVG